MVRITSLARDWLPPAVARAAQRYLQPDMPHVRYRAVAPSPDHRDLAVCENLRFLSDHVARRLQTDASVLDVGCGSGRYAELFAQPGSPTAGWQYGGTERSETMAEEARKLHPGVAISVSQDGLPYPDESFDLVFASSMIQYTGDAWSWWLGELLRVSRGLVAITRLPLVRFHASQTIEQEVRRRGRVERLSPTLLNQRDFEAAVCAAGACVLVRDIGTDVCAIEGLSELAIGTSYLLQRSAER